MNILLKGVVGSTAYGLAGPDSDLDYLGVYAAHPSTFFGLSSPPATINATDLDCTIHEVRKYVGLALNGNPTLQELMWLPDDLYTEKTELGQELIDIRTAFLSAERVRDAYLGYAVQQFNKLKRRGDGSFSADTRKRTAKHARHLMRLVHQGTTLYTTGFLPVRLKNPENYLQFGEDIASGQIVKAEYLIARARDIFDTATPAIPQQPDAALVEQWLIRTRTRMLKPE
ncbi:nucleotidyltransferase [Herbidospora galbida]|uniref:Nucleotidyltransferase n=1 Tax=Herbidospora galbida TaxID=2575442 RepID=A0A4U3M9C6_9ACTN|nr:nucleotidyltransferase domain-containing protein [Herbidospora galbida]TKK84664.1 nucleotidyltransferase [Herbidospora galbida]